MPSPIPISAVGNAEMTPEPITAYSLTPHAAFEIKRRGLSEKIVRQVLNAPEQRYQVRAGRDILQSRVSLDTSGKVYLVRVFVDIDRQLPEVVTAYRTSKIDKYWR
jgi:hypothetical protein